MKKEKFDDKGNSVYNKKYSIDCRGRLYANGTESNVPQKYLILGVLLCCPMLALLMDRAFQELMLPISVLQ